MGGEDGVNFSVRKFYISHRFVCLRNMIALRVMVGAVHLIACFSFHLPLVALFYVVITKLCKHNVFGSLMTSLIKFIFIQINTGTQLFLSWV